MLNLMKLESRIVLDGAAVAGALDHATDHDDAQGFDNDPGEMNVQDHQEHNTEGDVEHTTAVADAAALLADNDSDFAGESDSEFSMLNSRATVSVTMLEDDIYVFNAADFGSNFTKIQIVALEKSGDLKLNGDDVVLNQEITIADITSGRLTFTPNQDANNDNAGNSNYSDFKFKLNDGTSYGDADTMSINVTPVQDAPTSVDSAVTTKEDTDYEFSRNDFLFNDVDAVGAEDLFDSIQVTQLVTNGKLTLNGSDVAVNDVILVGDLDNLVFTPDSEANGTPYTGFQFKVSDGQDFSTDSYTMTINVSPVNDLPAGSDKTITIYEDNSYTFTVDDFGFSDTADGDTLSVVQITRLETAGTLKLNGADVSLNADIPVADIIAGKLIFTPDQDANGDNYASFSFKVYDGTDYSADSNTVTVNVNEVNDPPTADNSTVVTDENTDYTFKVEDFNYEDIENDDFVKIQITQPETAGTLKLKGVEIGYDTEVLISDIKAGLLVFSPASNQSGDGYSNFRFKVNDGASYSDNAYTMTMDVTQVNDLPTASDNIVTTEEDTDYVFKRSDFKFDDADNDSFVQIQLIKLETAGTLKLDGEEISMPGAVISVEAIDAGRLVFTPIPNDHGAEYSDFQFKVYDGTDYSASAYKMTIDVTPANDLPTASPNTVTMNQDETYIFKKENFNFQDIDYDDFAGVQITELETAGSLKLDGADVVRFQDISIADIEAGRLTFTPDDGAEGNDYASFKFKVSDGTAHSSDPYAMTVDVIKGNIPPESSGNIVTTKEDEEYVFSAEDFKYYDADGDSFEMIKITRLETAGTLMLNGSEVGIYDVISIEDINAGNFRFVPNKDANDDDANGEPYSDFGFKVNDGTAYSTEQATMTISVEPVQDIPTASDNLVQVDENENYEFSPDDFVFNDVDKEDKNLVMLEITKLETAGSLQLNGVDIALGQQISLEAMLAGRFTFTPVPNEHGNNYATFSFKVSDGKDFSEASYKMTIDVLRSPERPIVVETPPEIDEDGIHVFNLEEDFKFENTDFAKDFLKIQITKTVTSGTLKLDGQDVGLFTDISVADIAAGKLTFEPNQDANDGNGETSFDFKFRVYDTQDQTWSVTPYVMQIHVNPVNDPPIGDDNAVEIPNVYESDEYVFQENDFKFNDYRDMDQPGESITFEAVRIVTDVDPEGELLLNGVEVTPDTVITVQSIRNGELVYKVDKDKFDSGSYTTNFTFTVIDTGVVNEESGSFEGAPYTMTINVLKGIQIQGELNINDIWEDNHIDPYIDFEKFENPEGQTVAEILEKVSIIGMNGESLKSIAIIGAEDGDGGTWEYSLDNGTTWNSIDDGSIDADHGLLLKGDARIRFTPNQDYNSERNGDNITFTVRGWDGVTGSEGSYANTVDIDAFSVKSITGLIEVLAVNDAPTVEVPNVHAEVEVNTSITISGITAGDIDINEPFVGENPDRGNVEVTLRVDNGVVKLTHDNGLTYLTSSEASEIRFTGSLEDVNAALANSVLYTPDQDYVGEDELNIAVNDMGNWGAPGERQQIERTAMTMTVYGPNPHHEEPKPLPEVVRLIDIPRPIIGEQEGLELGEVIFPGPVLPRGEIQRDFTRSIGPPCEDAELYKCCTLEEALRIGCRLAPALDPDSRLCNITWNYMSRDLGWEPPFRVVWNDEVSDMGRMLRSDGETWEYFSEELDLFNQLFMRGPEGESFNDMGAGELAEIYGMAEEEAFAENNRNEEHDIFNQTSMQNETFNTVGPGELLKVFLDGREELADVPPGRWSETGNLEDC